MRGEQPCDLVRRNERDVARQGQKAAMPLRGPAVGAYRTGWRTRDFDPWVLPRRLPVRPDPRFARQRLEEETVVLPLVALDWVWIERTGGPGVRFDPRTGPAPTGFDPSEIHTFSR